MRNETVTHPWYKKWWGVMIIAVIVVYFGSALIVRFTSDFSDESTTQNSAPSSEDKTQQNNTIAYEEVESWQLENGKGKVIVIDPKYNNESDLRKLGEQVNKEELNNGTSYIYVFSNAEAARYRKTIKCDPNYNPESKQYSQYRLALYTKGPGETKYTIFDKRDCSDGNNQNIIIEY